MAASGQPDGKEAKVLRRDFLLGGGTALAAGALTVCVPESMATAQETAAARTAHMPSTGYVVYDSRLCFGCQSCMYACAMTHEGEAAPALSRIQIIRDAPSFTKYPYDIVMSLCRHCVSPLCVQHCPTGACHVDEAHGNIRRIDQARCIGCKRCISACPQRPHRTVWNPAKKKSAKCDLCLDAPYWSQQGGPEGKQACVEICPAKALKLVHVPPSQTDIAGYDVHLAPEPKSPGPKAGSL